MSPDWWSIAFGMTAGFVLLWLALVVFLWLAKPDDIGLREATRLVPDLLRLLKRLAEDPTMPKGIRIRLALLLGYLALPFDLIRTSFQCSAMPTTRSSWLLSCAPSLDAPVLPRSPSTGPGPRRV